MADDTINDLMDEGNEFGEIASRMNALNEEYRNNIISRTIKFDAFRRNVI